MASTRLVPELELLLCCARAARDAEAGGRIEALVSHGLDWERVLRHAGRHGLTPLLGSALEACCPTAVPAAVRARLGESLSRNLHHSLIATRELLDLLALFEAHDFRAVPFKGPLLAAQLYGSPSLRYFSDVDVLVDPADAAGIRQLLLSRGYQPQFEIVSADEPLFLRTSSEQMFVATRTGTRVDIHWRLTPPFYRVPLEFERLWERLRWTSTGSRRLPAPAPEDQLLLLCVHGAKHGWERLQWVFDVAALLHRRGEIDWPGVFGEARRLRAVRIVALGILVASSVAGARPGADIVRWAERDRGAVRLAARVRARAFRGTEAAAGVARTAWFRVMARDRLIDRLRDGCSLLMTPTPADLQQIRVRGPLFVPCCLLRHLRIAAHAARSPRRTGRTGR